jgi:acetyl-CoA carboxylase carboxyltransferase component
VLGNSYGAGNYAMCGKAYDPRFIYAWPTAKIAVMGGSQAAKTLMSIEVSALEKRGEQLSEEQKAEFLKNITERYESQTKVEYAAARLWVDAIIDPADTRKRISAAIDAANHQPEIPEFKTGVLQT